MCKDDQCFSWVCHHPDFRSTEETSEIVANPMAWLERKKKERRRFNGTKYLITFTRNPNSRFSLEEWLKRIKKEVLRKCFSEQYCSLEHPESNIHIHAIVSSNKPISKSLFYVFNDRYGFVDVRRINVDNGVLDYIEKELPGSKNAMDISEFKKFVLPNINEQVPPKESLRQ